MKHPTWRRAGTEAKLLLVGIPVLLWTMLPIYHLFLFAISPKESAFAGKLWPDHPTLHNFEVVFRHGGARITLPPRLARRTTTGRAATRGQPARDRNLVCAVQRALLHCF